MSSSLARRSRPVFTLVAAIVTLLSARGAASAQIGDLIRSAGVGITVGAVIPTDDEVDVGATWGFTAGLAPRKGWGLTGNLGWYEGDLFLNRSGLGDPNVGTVHVKPIMGGVGYTWMSMDDRLATTAAFTIGVSFNSADVASDYKDIFGPGTVVELDMDNSFAARPSLQVQYALTPKFALVGWGGYFVTKVNSTLRTPVGTYDDEWNANCFTFSVGVMVFPFRK